MASDNPSTSTAPTRATPFSLPRPGRTFANLHPYHQFILAHTDSAKSYSCLATEHDYEAMTLHLAAAELQCDMTCRNLPNSIYWKTVSQERVKRRLTLSGDDAVIQGDVLKKTYGLLLQETWRAIDVQVQGLPIKPESAGEDMEHAGPEARVLSRVREAYSARKRSVSRKNREKLMKMVAEDGEMLRVERDLGRVAVRTGKSVDEPKMMKMQSHMRTMRICEEKEAGKDIKREVVKRSRIETMREGHKEKRKEMLKQRRERLWNAVKHDGEMLKIELDMAGVAVGPSRVKEREMKEVERELQSMGV